MPLTSAQNLSQNLAHQIDKAAEALLAGGVIAYPTEYCFGLGCDPRNILAMKKLLNVKRRKPEQGVILIAANLDQVQEYADVNKVQNMESVTSSWPGPNTWLLPVKPNVSQWVRGKHASIAMRIPDHALCLSLLATFGHPIVSTSANRTGEQEHLDANAVRHDLGKECDYIIDAPVGGASNPSTIRDALTGATLR